MKFKIGDEVKTTCEHYSKYFYTFMGKVDDIQENIITVYGHISNGLGAHDDKYLRDLHTNALELSNEWFKEFCWVCKKINLVHNDEQCTFADPGFICKECELAREAHEDYCQINGQEIVENLCYEDMMALYK